jgi:hypothetical protein
MQGALYFPYIAVPESAWWTRTMLYWDRVATIVPEAFFEDPELHEPYTLELIRAGLIEQISPQQAAGERLEENFGAYLASLTAAEVDRRREGAWRGQWTPIHFDKWLYYASGLAEVDRLGLGYIHDRNWTYVETTTANEFMAALTMACCERLDIGPMDALHRTWVPTTDSQDAFDALLAGFRPVPGQEDRSARVRALGELRVAGLRSDLLGQLLPVPDETMPTERLVAFRRKHGDRLPAFRRYLEEKVDEAITIDDDELRFRKLDRLSEEVWDAVTEADAYLREAGFRRIGRSTVLRLCRFVPGLRDAVGHAQEMAQGLQINPYFESAPLAYLAFARLALTHKPDSRLYEVDPSSGLPLIEVLDRRRLGG